MAKKSTPKRKRTSAKAVANNSVGNVDKAIREAVARLFRPDEEAYRAASQIVYDRLVESDSPIVSDTLQAELLASLALSGREIAGYSTLDSEHISEIKSLSARIEKYVEDKGQERPLNVLMLATPGSGKSHFVLCIAKRLENKKVSAVTFNMATMQSSEDLVRPLDAVRNLKVEDRIPLLFLDEFDSSRENITMLLPLLWDGELNVADHELKIGKVIIVLAGSDSRIPELMDHARGMSKDMPLAETDNPKLIDLFSRINGGEVRIPPFFDKAIDVDRRPDKVCMLALLLKLRFGKQLRSVPAALFRFVARVDFRYDARSLKHFVNQIPYVDNIIDLKRAHLELPFGDSSASDDAAIAGIRGSTFAFHLYSDEQAYGIARAWKNAWLADSSNVLIRAAPLELLPPVSHFDRVLDKKSAAALNAQIASKARELVDWVTEEKRKIPLAT